MGARRFWLQWLGIEVATGCDIHRSVRFDVSRGGTITIGRNCILEAGCILESYGGSILLEDGVFLGPYCVMYGHGGLHVGANTMIATHSVLIPANHGLAGSGPIRGQPESRKGIRIGSDCWLGSGTHILDGVEIGEGCVIGAGSVVSRPIPPRSIAVGVPAKVVRNRAATEAMSGAESQIASEGRQAVRQ